MADNPQDDLPNLEMLLRTFNEWSNSKKEIFWVYFLYQHTNGALGGNPRELGSVKHYRMSGTFFNNLTHGQFNYRAKKVAPVAVQFHAGKFLIFEFDYH